MRPTQGQLARTGVARAEFVRLLVNDPRIRELDDELAAYEQSVPGYMLSGEEAAAWRGGDLLRVEGWLAAHPGLIEDVTRHGDERICTVLEEIGVTQLLAEWRWLVGGLRAGLSARTRDLTGQLNAFVEGYLDAYFRHTGIQDETLRGKLRQRVRDSLPSELELLADATESREAEPRWTDAGPPEFDSFEPISGDGPKQAHETIDTWAKIAHLQVYLNTLSLERGRRPRGSRGTVTMHVGWLYDAKVKRPHDAIEAIAAREWDEPEDDSPEGHYRTIRAGIKAAIRDLSLTVDAES